MLAVVVVDDDFVFVVVVELEEVGSGAVGSGAVVVAAGGGGATAVVTALGLELSPRAIATAAPAIATTRVSTETQIQSPGYQPSRRSQPRRSAGIAPVTLGRRIPHSTQYS